MRLHVRLAGLDDAASVASVLESVANMRLFIRQKPLWGPSQRLALAACAFPSGADSAGVVAAQAVYSFVF
jgi:hypothetical protein